MCTAPPRTIAFPDEWMSIPALASDLNPSGNSTKTFSAAAAIPTSRISGPEYEKPPRALNEPPLRVPRKVSIAARDGVRLTRASSPSASILGSRSRSSPPATVTEPVSSGAASVPPRVSARRVSPAARAWSLRKARMLASVRPSSRTSRARSPVRARLPLARTSVFGPVSLNRSVRATPPPTRIVEGSAVSTA